MIQFILNLVINDNVMYFSSGIHALLSGLNFVFVEYYLRWGDHRMVQSSYGGDVRQDSSLLFL